MLVLLLFYYIWVKVRDVTTITITIPTVLPRILLRILPRVLQRLLLVLFFYESKRQELNLSGS